MEKLSEHFSLEEMVSSVTAIRRGIINKPGITEQINLRNLCNSILEPIRQKYGHAIIINSGYRCPKLNAAVGGSKTSQHMTGSAADISCAGSKAALFHIILQMVQKGEIQVGQLIWEYGSKTEPNWIHVSLPNAGKRNQVLYLYSKK